MARNQFGCICDVCGEYNKHKNMFYTLVLPTYEREIGNCLRKDDYCFKCYDKLKKLLRDYYINEKGDNICSE